MDENETDDIETYELIPRLHNVWSVLVLASGWVNAVAHVTADTMQSAHLMVAQHAMQKNTDHEFSEMMKNG